MELSCIQSAVGEMLDREGKQTAELLRAGYRGLDGRLLLCAGRIRKQYQEE